ncbi:MAG: hypothetical protein ACRC3Z_01360 [Phocaeicola sp.]
MKYLVIFLSCCLGLSACSQQEELLAVEGNLPQPFESPYRVNVQWASQLDAHLDSCVISTLSAQPHSLPTIYSVAGASLQFDDENVAMLLESYEQNETLTCSFYFSTSMGEQSYTVSIDQPILSRTAYTFVLNQEGSDLLLSLAVTPWKEGGTIVTGPEAFQYSLDVDASQLPAYVRVSPTQDTLFVPACQTELLISLAAQIEAGWLLQGHPLTLKRVQGMDYLANQFQICLPAKSLGETTTVSNLYFGERGSQEFSDKPLVIVQESLRLELLQNQVTAAGSSVTYPTYVDGTLACVKEGYSVQSYTINSDSPASYEWIVMQRRGGQFYVEGGFKPNDSEAYGQLQTSRITIEYSDGVEEEYAFTRHRLALPVVKFGAHYWSKFNMRGNSKGYEDQIGFDLDRSDMWSYLKNCDGNAFIAYAGSQYCGTNPEGLDMEKNSTGGFSYQGYPEEFGSTTINDIQIDSHCPAGYQVPTEEEMKTLISGSVIHLVGLSTMQEYQNAYLVNKERYTVDRHRRGNIVKSGITIPNVYHLKITNLQGQEMVMHGVGYQSEANAINYGYWLYAAVSDGKDQAGFNNNRNNFYMQAHSGKKTVSVRCIKSPVHYIIE